MYNLPSVFLFWILNCFIICITKGAAYNIWVPKVSEFGMTLNMARPAAWFILFMIIVFPIIPIVIMIIMT
ncbi:hypothetical protein CW674_04075 [Macrococcoides caseolyticum]|nr:hypothetical protein CW688_10085 [Macrococcus caseolyticus]PKE35232.1 hypothetical protein CW695_09340 [Macrococcus caseolyticus]PKE51191.1 hypothetical protein CW672_02615 [Macrococcus caseolyticus]PKE65853.1 hypothetical protein CW674_04075 [Macrococcus caseolyticus]PKE71560.1 hypothetical protein CW665_09730 [Macrococcus caseolyticus]